LTGATGGVGGAGGGREWPEFDAGEPPPDPWATAGAAGAGGDDRPPPTAPDSDEDAQRVRAEQEEQARARRRRELEEFEEDRRQARRKVDEREAESVRRDLRLTPASSFRLKPVRWVWQDRMPLGEITLIPGREGVGKSTFLAWMASAITGGTLPGMWHGTPRSVLYAATEDSWEYTIAPRMLAAGADMGRVFRIDVQVSEETYGKLSLPLDAKLIVKAARETEAAVLMCDPIISLVSDAINTFKAQELRSALEPLKRAAEEAGLALPGLVHFNKTKDTDVLSMISGSRAWAEVARAVLAIAKDDEAQEATGRYTCVVSQVKNNLGRSDLPHLSYTIETTTIPLDEPDEVSLTMGLPMETELHIGRLAWLGESDRGAEDILKGPAAKPRRSDETEAVAAFVIAEVARTGVPVTTAQVRRHFADEMTDAQLVKILSRCVTEYKTLAKAGHGKYTIPSGRSGRKACPGCGGMLPPGSNFCARCRAGLDREHRAESSSDDR
jgi:hypothetical protein